MLLIPIAMFRPKVGKLGNIVPSPMFPTGAWGDYTGCLKKNAMEIQQAVMHHKRG